MAPSSLRGFIHNEALFRTWLLEMIENSDSQWVAIPAFPFRVAWGSTVSCSNTTFEIVLLGHTYGDYSSWF